MNRIDPEKKRLWVDALRSGEFEQGQGAMCYVTASGQKKYCCLGVISELAARAGVCTSSQREGDDAIEYDHETGLPPLSVRNWLRHPNSPGLEGLPSSNPRVDVPERMGELGGSVRSLANLNDVGVSFADIADLIEEQL